MSPVTTLTLPTPTPDLEIVDRLRELLVKAEKGEIVSFAAVAEMTGRELATLVVRGSGGSIYVLLGGVQELSHRILTEEIEQP